MKEIKYIICLFVMVVSLLQPAMQVHASSAIGSPESFNHLTGDAKYLGDGYWKNYYLDVEELGDLNFGESILHKVANMLFSFCKWVAYLTVVIFYLCFNLNLSDLFGSQISAIQQALNDSIFSPLFFFGCFAAFCVLTGRILKQDLAGALGQIAKVIFIVMFSILVVRKSDVMLSTCNNITKEVSVEILTGINSADGMEENIDNFAARGAGVLWRNLIHEPWMTLEFDNAPGITENDVQGLLTLEGGSDARDELVKGYDIPSFHKERLGEKAGFMLLYIIPFLLKCGIYIVVAIIQLLFQLVAIFFTFMAPLVLIISMVPGYETILTSWLRKILESQISILIISLMIGILIKFDELIFDWAATNDYGWMIALVLQTAMAIGLFINRNKLLTVLSDVQRGVSNPRYLRNRMRLAGNVYQTVPKVRKEVKYTVDQIRTGRTAAVIGRVKGRVKDKITEVGNRPVKTSINPFADNFWVKKLMRAKKEDDNEEDETTEKSVKSGVKAVQQDTVAAAVGTEETDTQEERPASVVPPKNINDEDRSNSGIRNESLKELADDISQNIARLAEVIESAEDFIRTDQEKSQNDEAKRPTLMGDKKESDGKTSKENKEITITMKGADGKEERQKVSTSGKMDVQSYKNQSESSDVERPRTDRNSNSGNLEVAHSIKENQVGNEEYETPEGNEGALPEENVETKVPFGVVAKKGVKTQDAKKAVESAKVQTDTQKTEKADHANQTSSISAVIAERNFTDDRGGREVMGNSVNIVKGEETPVKDKRMREGVAKDKNMVMKSDAEKNANVMKKTGSKKESADVQKSKRTVPAKNSVSAVVKERTAVNDKSNAARVERSVKEK